MGLEVSIPGMGGVPVFIPVDSVGRYFTMPVLTYHGEVDGSATAEQLPNKAGRLVRITAAYDNAGYVYIGLAGVTKKDGTLDTTTGVPIAAGEFRWFFVAANLNELYQIADNATDDLIYEVYA